MNYDIFVLAALALLFAVSEDARYNERIATNNNFGLVALLIIGTVLRYNISPMAALMPFVAFLIYTTGIADTALSRVKETIEEKYKKTRSNFNAP